MLEAFTAPVLEQAFRLLASEYGLKIGPLLTPFRVAITGKEVAPPLFESMVVLGRSETLARLDNALAALQREQVPAA
jgi:glutamyl-tRNA synthetase